jgi:probable H4MPT-linked C1 transfer pathway protein
MPTNIIGLDIGGANLKAADGRGWARSVPFALWREPQNLARRLTKLLELAPPSPEASLRASGIDSGRKVALTMTGELCDCFATKREGVEQILRSVLAVVEQRQVLVWSNGGEFLSVDQAIKRPLEVASANWLATAVYCANWLRQREDALLIDVGSTTTDLIPIRAGRPQPRGRTDLERLAADELVYRGMLRTPVAALAEFVSLRGRRVNLSAELFATTWDVYLLLGQLPEESDSTDTADGRPATIASAHARLARMVCADAEVLSLAEVTDIARQLDQGLRRQLRGALWRVRAHAGLDGPVTGILAGSGELLARAMLADAGFELAEVISLTERLGPQISCAICAHAVACLAGGEAGIQ